jgi:hypothetical protein
MTPSLASSSADPPLSMIRDCVLHHELSSRCGHITSWMEHLSTNDCPQDQAHQWEGDYAGLLSVSALENGLCGSIKIEYGVVHRGCQWCLQHEDFFDMDPIGMVRSDPYQDVISPVFVHERLEVFRKREAGLQVTKTKEEATEKEKAEARRRKNWRFGLREYRMVETFTNTAAKGRISVLDPSGINCEICRMILNLSEVPEDELCSICRELLETTETSPIQLKCGHLYHRQCVAEGVINHDMINCPICRERICEGKVVVMPNFEREEHSTFSLKPPAPEYVDRGL